MYSEQDMRAINARIRRNLLIWVPVLGVLTACLIVALTARIKWMAYASAVMLAMALIFGASFYLIPNLYYRRFLNDLARGLTREMEGTILEISEKAETQDGAQVLPVRLMLADGSDERIVYLNASKTAQFPAVGQSVRLKLCGRHVRSAEIA